MAMAAASTVSASPRRRRRRRRGYILAGCCCSLALLSPRAARALAPASRRAGAPSPSVRPPFVRRGPPPLPTATTIIGAAGVRARPYRDRRAPPPSSSSLSLLPEAAASLLPSAALTVEDDGAALKLLAEGLGYLLGAGSVLLYAPIAVRVLRTRSAEGLAPGTFWLKLTSYTCSDVYNFRNGFPLAAYSELLVITLEAALVLALVTYYQNRVNLATATLACAYVVVAAWALLSPYSALPYGPPKEWIDAAQVLSTVLNASALLPQLRQNYDRGSSGDYSPVTASLAAAGCGIRLFTTVQLAGGDGLLLLNYGLALLLNLTVVVQVLYYGVTREGRSPAALFLADVRSSEGDAGLADKETVAEGR